MGFGFSWCVQGANDSMIMIYRLYEQLVTFGVYDS